MRVAEAASRTSTRAPRSAGMVAELFDPNPRTLSQKFVLAGWVTLMAEDRGLDAAAVAERTGLDPEQARAVLDGAVAAIPLPVLDRVLRRMEGRPD